METKTIEQILDDFLIVNQQVYSELASLEMTLEAIEIFIVPVERRMIVKIKEFKGNSYKTHQQERSLIMKDINFDNHVASTLPAGASLRRIDMRNLTPDKVEELLIDNQPTEM